MALPLLGSLALGLLAGGASVGLLALSGWFIAMSALAGAGLAAGFSFFYPSASVQALAVTRVVLRYLERLLGHSAALRLDVALKEAVFASAVAGAASRTRAAGHPDDRTGVLTHAVTSDAASAESALLRVAAPVVTYTGVLAGVSAMVAVTVSVPLAATIAIGGAAAALLVVAPAWLMGLRPGSVLAAAESHARQEIIDAADGLDELVAFGAVDLASGRIASALDEVARADRRLRRLAALTRAAAAAAAGSTVLLVGVACATGWGSAAGTRVALASAVAVTLATLGALQLSDPLAAAARETGRTRRSWRRLARVLAGSPGPVSPGPEPPVTARDLIPGLVQVSQLAAERGRGRLIDSLSVTVPPGQTLLITGPSGAGKSTLLAILAGWLPPAAGQARLDGVVVSLPQQPYPLRATLADNLRLGNPAASDENLIEAITLTGLGAAFEAEPLPARVGAGGRPLSGGELRRLSLAQALVVRPDVLIADEPVTGLDPLAAHEVLLGLRRGAPRATLVLALHEQDVSRLPWTPDLTIRLDTGTSVASVGTAPAQAASGLADVRHGTSTRSAAATRPKAISTSSDEATRDAHSSGVLNW
jgi:ATP-binding cassette, subfamily C, bacterial CydC